MSAHLATIWGCGDEMHSLWASDTSKPQAYGNLENLHSGNLIFLTQKPTSYHHPCWPKKTSFQAAKPAKLESVRMASCKKCETWWMRIKILSKMMAERWGKLPRMALLLSPCAACCLLAACWCSPRNNSLKKYFSIIWETCTNWQMIVLSHMIVIHFQLDIFLKDQTLHPQYQPAGDSTGTWVAQEEATQSGGGTGGGCPRAVSVAYESRKALWGVVPQS